MSNTITAYFKGRVGVAESVYQNDYGIIMNFDSIDLPAHFDCYFSILNQEEAIPGVGADGMVAIPNSVLANPGAVTIHIPLHTGANDSEVEYVVYFKVIGRARPIDDGTPAQMTAIEQALALLQNPITNIEQIVNEALSFTGDTFAEMQEQLDADQAEFEAGINARQSTVESQVTNLVTNVKANAVETLWTGTLQTKNQSVTLSEDISNFDFIDIYVSNDVETVYLRKPVSNTIHFEVQAQNMADDGTAQFMRWWETGLTISGTTATVTKSIACQWDDFASAPVVSEVVDGPKISRIDGVKIGSHESAEMTDIRVGADSVTYPTAGDAVRGQVTDLKSVNSYNDYKIVSGRVTPTSSTTSNGITASPNGDGSFAISGKATANVIACNFYNAYDNLPSFFQIGHTYTFMLETDSEGEFDLRLQTYVNQQGTQFAVIPKNKLITVTVPNGITGVSMYVRVPKGSIVNGNVRVVINNGTYTNRYLTQRLIEDDSKTPLQKDLDAVNNAFYPISGRFTPDTETTITGITIKPYGDGHFHISGTATANTIAGQFYVSATAFPDYFPKNKERTVQFLTDSDGYFEMRINIYNPSSTLFKTIYKNSSAQVKIPSDATGFTVYVRVPKGETVNGDVFFVVTDGTLTNKALSNKVATLSNSGLVHTADFSLFKSIGVIGDSFATGWFYKTVNGSMTRFINRDHSWPMILGRKHGVEIGHYCYGGLDTETWQTNEYGLPLLLASDPNECYLLMLGINDVSHRGSAGLGTIADIKSDYTQNPNTFYGDYGKIIAQIINHAPNAKLIISTMTHSGGDYDSYNVAIEEIAEHFGIACIRQLDSPYFSDASLYQSNWVNGHPTSIQCSAMASAINDLFTMACNEYYEYFADLC